jgi:transcription initiation factor TFIIB
MDRNLAYAMSELDRLSSQIGIPRTVKETAAVIYRKAIERHLIRGRSIEAMIAAAVYAAARIRRVPRTLDEIAKNSRISKKELGRCYRLIIRELQIRIPLANPNDYIIRFSAELRLSGHTAQRAIEIIDQAKENGLTAGKDPTGLAAASIYIAGIIEGERRTQREIAETATVTEVTVRNRYKELVRRLGIEITV